jgi:two-component system sensor histidine kinase ChiS
MTTESDNLLFAEGEESSSLEDKKDEKNIHWKVLIVDDDNDIHEITKLAFRDFKFENKFIEFLSAYSAKEAEQIIRNNNDIVLILLDVIMEEDDSGLKFAKFLREELNQKMMRVIMNTGQPGLMPEKEIIIKYDINDYKEKTDLTGDKFFTAMVMALRSYRDLAEIDKKREELFRTVQASSHFVPHNFLKFLGKAAITDIELGDHIELDMTVLFLDIRGFTAACQNLTPGEAYDFVNSIMACIEPEIIQQGGFIDKYIGDSIMALFSGPVDRALIASLNMIHSLNEYNNKHSEEGHSRIDIGIGINSGVLALGTIGFHDRMDCTVIGNVVNSAAKVEKLNKKFGTKLLITEKSFERVKHKNKFLTRSLGAVDIVENGNSISVIEVYDKESTDSKEKHEKKKK